MAKQRGELVSERRPCRICGRRGVACPARQLCADCLRAAPLRKCVETDIGPIEQMLRMAHIQMNWSPSEEVARRAEFSPRPWTAPDAVPPTSWIDPQWSLD